MGFEPYLLKHQGDAKARTLDHYLARSGYQGARKAFELQPAALIDLVKNSGLRGRGGAGFPTGMKWGFVPKNIPKPRYLCVNADESEPGTFKDRAIIEYDPHTLLEGILICCRAVEIHAAYIYMRAEFTLGAKIMQQAIDEAYAGGYFGKNIVGSGFDLDVTLHRGGGAYICGEETALLTSLEGNPGQPRIKPPFPAVVGLFGSPTVINNVETLANLGFILDRGIAWHKGMGTEKSPGVKIFGVCGHVNKPGLFEKPLGYPMKQLIYEDAGG
ncbi:MAG: NADH-quinone oxidoreductase subunit F, partial [Microthrixaceae bacterium]|nr:NADH-quinone oxidoreductase subunit F [Microthrixaceae bacterium]